MNHITEQELFYLNQGFYPLEVFTNLWNEENPCLFLIKVI